MHAFKRVFVKIMYKSTLFGDTDSQRYTIIHYSNPYFLIYLSTGKWSNAVCRYFKEFLVNCMQMWKLYKV